MKLKFLYLILILTCFLFTGGINASTSESLPPVLISKLPEPTPTAPVKSEIEEINISGETIAIIDKGDFENPTFSPDGKKIAYSKEDGRHAEIYIFDLQTKKTSVLLNSKQSQKYVPDGSQVRSIEWLSANNLRTYLSDGDVGGATLSFNPKTQRLIKGITEYYDENAVVPFPKENVAIYKLFLKSFSEIPKDAAEYNFSNHQFYKIGSRGVVLQFHQPEIDANVWYFDFQTKKKHLLVKAPPTNDWEFKLDGVTEIAGNILVLTRFENQTSFYTFKNGEVRQILKTGYYGFFQSLHVSSKKSFFLLIQDEFDSPIKSSLWVFDGIELKRAADSVFENIKNAAIDSTETKIAFSFETTNRQRNILVKKLIDDF